MTRSRLIYIGFALFLLGVGLNTLVVHLNGGMPAVPMGYSWGHWVVMDTARLAFLGDIIPVGNGFYASVGDVLMGLAPVFLCIGVYCWANSRRVTNGLDRG